MSAQAGSSAASSTQSVLSKTLTLPGLGTISITSAGILLGVVWLFFRGRKISSRTTKVVYRK